MLGIKEMISSNWVIFTGIAIIVLIVVLVFSLVGCSSGASSGEAFSIDNLSDEDIIHKQNATTFASSIKYNKGEKTGVVGASKYEDSDKVEFGCKKITGIKRISATKVAEGSTLTLKISSTLTSGKAKIVIISKEEIVEYIEFGRDLTLTYEVDSECIFYVKILAEDAELKITVEREISK